MGELGEIYRALREDGKERRNANLKSSPEILLASGIEFEWLSGTHIRVGPFDFWPSTGLFIHRKTKRRGRGVHNLIRAVKP